MGQAKLAVLRRAWGALGVDGPIIRVHSGHIGRPTSE
jgi:hypothetical protein